MSHASSALPAKARAAPRRRKAAGSRRDEQDMGLEGTETDETIELTGLSDGIATDSD